MLFKKKFTSILTHCHFIIVVSHLNILPNKDELVFLEEKLSYISLIKKKSILTMVLKIQS